MSRNKKGIAKITAIILIFAMMFTTSLSAMAMPEEIEDTTVVVEDLATEDEGVEDSLEDLLEDIEEPIEMEPFWMLPPNFDLIPTDRPALVNLHEVALQLDSARGRIGAAGTNAPSPGSFNGATRFENWATSGVVEARTAAGVVLGNAAATNAEIETAFQNLAIAINSLMPTDVHPEGIISFHAGRWVSATAGHNTSFFNINDGTLGGGYAGGTHWSTWGAAGQPSLTGTNHIGPPPAEGEAPTGALNGWMWARYDWPQGAALESSTIFVSTDTGGLWGPTAIRWWYLPIDAASEAASEWVLIEHRPGPALNLPPRPISSFPITIEFEEPIQARALRVELGRNGTGTSYGIAVREWQVFGMQDPALSDLYAIPEDFFMNLYQNIPLPLPALQGSTFVLDSSDVAALGNDGVINRIATDQTGTITVTATNGEFTATRTFNFSVLRTMAEAEAPIITIQPERSIRITGPSISNIIEVEAHVTDHGTLTFQWERMVDRVWVPIDGATEKTYTVPLLEEGATMFRVVITNTNNAADNPVAITISEVSVVTVVASVMSIAIRPNNVVMKYGSTRQFHVMVSTIAGAAQTVTWSLEGDVAAGTSISADGLLTLANDQPLGNLTVIATSTVNRNMVATANVLVVDIDAVRSPNVYHNALLRNPDTGVALSAGENADALAAFNHTGWHLHGAATGVLGPAVGYSRTLGGIPGGNSHVAQVFAAHTTANHSPGNFAVYAPSGLFLRRNTGADHSEFALYNGNARHGNAIGTNAQANFGYEFLDVEIHAGHRLTAGAGSIVFRFVDEDNFYFLRARAGQPYQLGRVLGGVETIIATSAGNQTMPATDFRLLRLTVEDNAVTFRTSTQLTLRASAASRPTMIFDGVSLIPEGETEVPGILNTPGQVGFRADANNVNAMWNHIQIASLETNFTLTSPEGMFRIETGANGNLQSIQVLQGRNWGFLQRNKLEVGVGAHTPVELLQNERVQPIMGGRHRSLGDMRFNYQVGDGAWQTASTGNSGDNRFMWQEGNTVGVEYMMPSENTRDGIRDFNLSQTFSVGHCPRSGDYIHFDFYITNTGEETITIRDMSMPVTWNHHFFGSNSGGVPADAYTWWLSAPRNYVALHGSYIMLERMDGASSKVVMVMDTDTNAKLEYRRYEVANHDNYSTNMMEEFFIYSVGVATAGTNGTRNQSYLPNTQLVLEPGESSRYGFRIFHIDDYPDLPGLLYDQGSVNVVVNPGTVTPMNIEALIAVYAEGDVTLTDITPPASLQTQGIGAGAAGLSTATWFTEANRSEWTPTFRHVEDRVDEEGRRIQVFGIEFNKLGRNDIQINFADGTRASVVQFWVMEDIGDAIQRKADFIMDNKWVSPELQEARIAAIAPNMGHSGTAYRDHLSNFIRDHRYGFMQFQNTGGYTRAGTGNAFACINSDYEQYYTWALFLAEKNITMPVQREIEALELYFTRLSYPMNVQPFGGYVDSARVRTDGFGPEVISALQAATAAVRTPSNNTYREGALAVKCCWQTNGFRMGGNSTSGGFDSAAARGIMHVHDRTYNYLHIASQFFSMYQIIRNNPHVEEYLQSDWCAVDYLRVAGIVAANSTVGMRGFGKMGESIIPQLYEALRYEYAAGNHGTYTLYNPGEIGGPLHILPGGGHTPVMNQGQRATTNREIAYRMRYGFRAIPEATPAIPAAQFTSTAVQNASGFVSKANGFSMVNPYGSEFWVDNTSEEGVYFLTTNFATFSPEDAVPGSNADRWNPNTFAQAERWQLPERVVDKMLGWTGMQPLWYHESTSRPMGADWWNFQYTVGLQGAALQHWFFNYEPDTDRANAMWNHVYSHSLAPFVGIMSGQPEIQIGPLTQVGANNARLAGVAPNEDMTRQGRGPMGSMWFINQPTRPYDFASNMHSMYAQSGEGGLLLWGGLRILHTSVVPDDPHFGLTAYGGTVELVDNEFVVVPQDGLRRRLSVVGQRFQANLRAHQYSEARIRTDFMGVEFDIENPSGLAREGFIEIRMLEPGAYYVYVDGVREEGQVIVEHHTDRNNLVLPTLFAYNATGAATQTIRIIHEDHAHTPGPVLSFDIFNNGEGGTPGRPNLNLGRIIRMWTQLDGVNTPVLYADLTVTARLANGDCAMEFIRINRPWVNQDTVNFIDADKNGDWARIYLTATVNGSTANVILVNRYYVPTVLTFDIFNNGPGGSPGRPNPGLGAAIRMWTQINGVNTPVLYADLTVTARLPNGDCAMRHVRINRPWVNQDTVNFIDVIRSEEWTRIYLTATVSGRSVDVILVN